MRRAATRVCNPHCAGGPARPDHTAIDYGRRDFERFGFWRRPGACRSYDSGRSQIAARNSAAGKRYWFSLVSRLCIGSHGYGDHNSFFAGTVFDNDTDQGPAGFVGWTNPRTEQAAKQNRWRSGSRRGGVISVASGSHRIIVSDIMETSTHAARV